jgi:hypothetical protein
MATAKLASLAIRTLAKPLANYIKERSVTHPKFKSFCITVANGYNRFEINLRTGFMGLQHSDHVPPLNEIRALELGATFLSESV